MFALDPSHCRRMLDRGTWSEQSFAIPAGDGEPMLSNEELYRACLSAARHIDVGAAQKRASAEERHKTSTQPGDVWFNVELEDQLYNRQKEPTRPEQMPLPEDGGLLAYAERMSRNLGGKNFCLRVTDVHCFDVEVFRKLCRYVATLVPSVRKDDPVQRLVRTILFVGDYAYTPFGSHKDPDPQFQYVIHGRRTAHVWTPECWKREPRNSLEAWRYLDEAETFELGTGEAIYWPAGHYHVFESHGLSMGLTFAFPQVELPATAEEREGLPSNHGFHNCPPPSDAQPLLPRDRLRGQGDLPALLLSTPTSASEHIIACNGHLLRVPASIDCAPIVARVNRGEAFACAEVMADVRAQFPADQRALADAAALEILRAFVATHGLDLI